MLSNFGWILPGRLAGMARPRPGAAAELLEEGIAAVLTLTESAPLGELGAAGLVVHHEPVPDFGVPTGEALARAVAFVRTAWRDGRGVVVHCHAGYGRTGTVLAAVLVDTGVAPEEAIDRIRELRPGSIETAGQEDAILRYALSRRADRPAQGGR